jgi:hypothetical protein
MSAHVVCAGPRATAETQTHAALLIARRTLRYCTINWTANPPTIVFTPDLTTAEQSVFAQIVALVTAGEDPETTGRWPVVGATPGPQGPPGPAGADGMLAHPDLAGHDALGLATQAELDAHAGTPHGAGAHSHPESEVTSLVTDLAGKAPTHSHPYAASVHGHAESEVTNLTADLAGKAASGHNHDAAYVGASHGHVDADLPAGLARDAEVAAAYAPIHGHPYEASGAVATHAAAADPHPGYLTPVEGDAAYATTGHAHSYQPLDSDLTAIAALSTTAFGRGLLALADAAALAAAHTHPGGQAAATSYAPGSFTVATGNYALMARRLQLTGSQRATLQGTARLRIM